MRTCLCVSPPAPSLRQTAVPRRQCADFVDGKWMQAHGANRVPVHAPGGLLAGPMRQKANPAAVSSAPCITAVNLITCVPKWNEHIVYTSNVPEVLRQHHQLVAH